MYRMRTYTSIVVQNFGNSQVKKTWEQWRFNDQLSVLVLALAAAFAACAPILVLILPGPWTQDRINLNIDWISGMNTKSLWSITTSLCDSYPSAALLCLIRWWPWPGLKNMYKFQKRGQGPKKHPARLKWPVTMEKMQDCCNELSCKSA